MDIVTADDGTRLGGAAYPTATAFVYAFVDMCGVIGVNVEVIVWRILESTSFEHIAPFGVVIQVTCLNINAAVA